MKQTSLSAFLFVSLAVGTLLYLNSPSEEQLDQVYESWKQEHNIGQDFNEAENLYRMKVFEQNLEEINTHNSLLGRSYEMGANRFSHLSKE
jgi:hypothetical protein